LIHIEEATRGAALGGCDGHLLIVQLLAYCLMLHTSRSAESDYCAGFARIDLSRLYCESPTLA
jgi:hypothetical protein